MNYPNFQFFNPNFHVVIEIIENIHKSISIGLFGNCRIPWATSDIRLIGKKM